MIAAFCLILVSLWGSSWTFSHDCAGPPGLGTGVVAADPQKLDCDFALTLGSRNYFLKKPITPPGTNQAPNLEPFRETTAGRLSATTTEKNIIDLNLSPSLPDSKTTSSSSLESYTRLHPDSVSPRRKKSEVDFTESSRVSHQNQERARPTLFSKRLKVGAWDRGGERIHHTLRYETDDNNQQDQSWNMQGPELNRETGFLQSQPKNIEGNAYHLASERNAKNRGSKKDIEDDKLQITSGHDKSKLVADVEESNKARFTVNAVIESSQQIIETDRGSKEPITIIDAGSLSNKLWKDLEFFEATIEKPSEKEKAFSLYVCLELLGTNIINQLQTNGVSFKNTLQLQHVRQSFESHAMKAIVSYIQILHDSSETPLFGNPDQLATAQRNAILYVKKLWEESKHPQDVQDEKLVLSPSDEVQDKKHVSEPPDEGQDGHNTSNPLDKAEKRVKALVNYPHFSYANSNNVCSLVFLMWMRGHFLKIYHAIHLKNDEFQWQTRVLGILHVQILHSKSVGELLEAVDKFTWRKSSINRKRVFSYNFKKPFKIKWLKTLDS